MNAPPIAELAQALFDDATDALLLIDKQTARVQDANREAQRLFDRDAGQLRGCAFIELVVADHPDRLKQFSNAFAESQRWQSSAGFSVGSPPVPVEVAIRPCGLTAAIVQVRDIRPLSVLESRTAAAESELGLLLGAIPAAVWCAERTADANMTVGADALTSWQFRFLSPSVERVTGWPVSYFLDGPWKFTEIIHPDDRQTILSERAAFLLSPDLIFSTELRVVGADGFVRWIRSDIQATRDDRGVAVRLDCVLTDINRPKIAELSLCESQRWLTRLLETSTNGVLILDLAGRITLANRAAEQITGLPDTELLDRDWNDLPWAPESAESIQDGVDLAFRTLQNGELKLIRPDGRQVTLAMNAAPLRDDAGQIVGVVLTLTDMSQRRQAEEAVRRSEERYRRLFERNLAGVCRYTLDGRFLDANPAYARIFGYDTPDKMRAVPGPTLHVDVADREQKLRQLLADGFLTNIESHRRRKDGSDLWVLENVTLVEEAGAPIIEATLVDITERRQAQHAIASEHALMRTLLKSIPDAIFFKGRDGRYLGCNPAFEDSVGLREHEILGRTTCEVFPAELARVMLQEDEEVYSSGKPLRIEKQSDRNGGPRYEELLLHPMLDDEGAIVGILGVGRDITERRQIEEQLRQTGKMEGIGRLAGGVAHDFNNLLTVILGNITLLRSIMRGADDACELLADCEQAAQRASELTNQLLGFARRKPLALQPLDLNRRVAETTQMLRRTIDPNIRIHIQPQPELWGILGDASHLGQVLMNLCLNARDAMAPVGGRIHIETGNVVLVEPILRDNADARTGEFVRLTVTDDGPGIPPEVKARIFEPFFTTKPLGKGTGLGLAVVFGIVKQHNGWIACRSEPGKGTRFDIYFPRSLEVAALPAPPAPIAPRKGNETILLVDDEAMIRHLGRSILEQQGYRILQAEDGLIALDVYQQYLGEIDLVILDLTMPNLSGRETFHRLKEIDPHAGVVFSSGYTADEFEPGELDGILGFIPKPYRLQDLAVAVRTALDRANHRGNGVFSSGERPSYVGISSPTS